MLRKIELVIDHNLGSQICKCHNKNVMIRINMPLFLSKKANNHKEICSCCRLTLNIDKVSANNKRERLMRTKRGTQFKANYDQTMKRKSN